MGDGERIASYADLRPSASHRPLVRECGVNISGRKDPVHNVDQKRALRLQRRVNTELGELSFVEGNNDATETVKRFRCLCQLRAQGEQDIREPCLAAFTRGQQPLACRFVAQGVNDELLIEDVPFQLVFVRLAEFLREQIHGVVGFPRCGRDSAQACVEPIRSEFIKSEEQGVFILEIRVKGPSRKARFLANEVN